MEKELEEKRRLEEKEEEKRKRKSTNSRDKGAAVAKPGTGARNKRFMPKKRGRIGL